MIKIRIWDLWNSEESDAKEIEVESFAHIEIEVRRVAEASYCEECWDSAEYCVRVGDSLLKFDVQATPSVDFNIREKR